MLPSRTLWFTLILGLVVPGFSAVAGEQKKDEPKSSAPLLSKVSDLTSEDEKDTHPLLTNSPRRVYKLKLTEGKTYTIDLKSKAFDAVLRLENAAGKEVAFNDDFEPGQSLDSRLVYKALKSEEYRIIVTSLDNKTGRYTLLVTEGGKAAEGGAAVGGSMFQAKGSELKLAGGKGKFEGEITTDDANAKNHFYKLFTVKLEAGKTYRIDHMSDDFDAFLFLEDPDGKTLAQDDDGGEGLNSRIVYKASAAGTYRVIATTLFTKKTGKFNLEINPASAAEEKEAAFNERVAKLADAPAAERTQLLADVLKRFQDKGEKLSINDARMAFQITSAVEEIDADVAKKTYGDYIKLFKGAENKQVASVARQFEGALKKLDMLGKTIEISGKTVEGKDFDLKNMKGKVVLVDFWATWCGPCIAEIPNMEAAFKKYHGRGFDIIGVSLDRTDDAIVKFNEARKIPWQSINVEDSRTLADRYSVNAIPFPVLVDANGRVVSLRARGPQLERLLEKMLGEKK